MQTKIYYSTSHGSHCKLVKNSSQLFTESLECKDCLYSLIDCLHRCELKVKGRIDQGFWLLPSSLFFMIQQSLDYNYQIAFIATTKYPSFILI